MCRKQACRLSESSVVAARRIHGAFAADKLHSPPLSHFFNFSQQNGSNLPSSRHMGATTSRQIEIVDIDEPQLVPFGRGKFAQAETLCLFVGDKANADATV